MTGQAVRMAVQRRVRAKTARKCSVELEYGIVFDVQWVSRADADTRCNVGKHVF